MTDKGNCEVKLPATYTIYGRFHTVAEKYPDYPAVVSGGKTYTYRELDQRATRCSAAIARDLASRGIDNMHGQRIGIVMDHGIDMITAILAVLRAGAAYVPAEPTFPTERRKFMMDQACAPIIITSLPDDKTGHTAPTTLPYAARPCDPAYILYTSGTTGKPKGVVVSNANVCHYARAFQNEFHIVPGKDRMLQHSVCSFDIFVEEVFGTLLNGGCLVIPPAKTRESIPALVKFIDDNGITMLSGFPYLLLEFDKYPEFPKTLRLLISGGDVLRASYIQRLLKRGAAIYNTYGPSETTVCTTYCRCDNRPPLDDGTYPIGRPVKGVLIVDTHKRPLPAGMTGEIAIMGDGVSMGYLADCPEQANFTTMPDGRRAYLSGDLGCMLPDGNLVFEHRKDSQVMILGRRVECEEVSNVLCECDAVERGVVTANYDTDGLAYLTAYFVPRSAKFSLEEMKQTMARQLASFMMPEYYVEMPSLPVNANGKVNRGMLPVILKEGRLRS